MASDEISVRLDEIAESLNRILEVAADLPVDGAPDVTGPFAGVTRAFKSQLNLVAAAAQHVANSDKIAIHDLADSVVTTVHDLESADKISATQATQLEQLLTVPETPPTTSSYTPVSAPAVASTPAAAASDSTATDWVSD